MEHRRNDVTKNRVGQNKSALRRVNTVKPIVCGLLVLAGVAVRVCFGGSELHTQLSEIMHSNFDYHSAATAVGKAIVGDRDVISVFKNIVNLSDDNEGQEEKSENAPVATTVIPAGDNIEIRNLKHEQDVRAIEELSFTMSADELSDDTANEAFVIPPPSYCSYDKANITFKYTVPVYGRITSRYGYRDHPVGGDAGFHSGIDIAASQGSMVRAFADGKVLQASTNKVYGKFLLLEHEDGIRSFYGHNSRLCVKKGECVKMGQKIAEVGTTGLSTGPHVHFEVRKGNMRFDPAHYINPENI